MIHLAPNDVTYCRYRNNIVSIINPVTGFQKNVRLNFRTELLDIWFGSNIIKFEFDNRTVRNITNEEYI